MYKDSVIMTIDQALVIRDKFKRASTPKVRTGCVTWYVITPHLS